MSEHEADIRRCLNKGAHKVQVDFTEARLAVKIDPSGHLLNSFIDLSDDTSTSRDTAFAKIQARVRGTALAATRIGASQ